MKTVNKSIKNASKSDQAITSKVHRCRKKLLELNAPHDDGCIWTAYDCYNYFYNKPYSDNEKYSDGETYRNDWMDHKNAVSWFKHEYDYNIKFRDTYHDELLNEFGYKFHQSIYSIDEYYKVTRWYIKPLDSVIKIVAENEEESRQECIQDGEPIEPCYNLILPTRSQYQWER